MKPIKFIKYQSLYDPEIVLFALDDDPVTKEIDGIVFIESTPNFKDVQMVRLDSLKVIGFEIRKV